MPNNSLRFFRNKQQRIELTFHAPIIIPVPVRSEASKHKLFHPLLKKNKKKTTASDWQNEKDESIV